MALTQISTAGVKDDAVTAGKIPANAVGSSELADNAVDTAAIADDAVTADKLANSINTSISNKLPLAGGTLTGNLVLSNHHPKLSFTDTDHNSDFQIMNNHGNLLIYDETNATSPFNIDSSGNIQVSGTVDGVDISALNSTVSGLSNTTINNNADNRVITGSGTANTLEGEANLTFDGANLSIPSGIYHTGDTNTAISFPSNDAIDLQTAGASRLRVTSGNVGVHIGSPVTRFQVGSHTFSGGHGMYENGRVGMANHGSLTGLMLASTYNDAGVPEYGIVFVQGPDTSNYNVWSISPDGPAKGNSLSLHYGAQNTNIHILSNRKFEFDGDGDFRLTAGNVDVASGYGIDFSATSNASGMTSELLDDYEEGTWSPSGSWTSITGTYTKIGRVVHAAFAVTSNTSSGNMTIGNLPFNCGNNEASRNGIFWGWNEWDSNSHGQLTGNINPGGNTLTIYIMNGSGGTATYSQLGNSKTLKGVICYQTA